MVSWKKIVLLCLVLLIVVQSYRLIRDSGLMLEIQTFSYGTCDKMYGPPGAEDINIDHTAQVAFISAGNGRAVFDQYRTQGTQPVVSGDIWLLDLADPGTRPKPLNVKLDWAFHPHGIDLLHLPDGGRELYVVNHPARDQHEILVFTIAPDHQMSLKRQISYPELISPNDVVAIDSERFFVTNDHGSPRSSTMFWLEDYLGLSRTSVTYFDGEAGSFVVKGLKSANGIELSEDQHTMYVAEAIGRSVKRYERGESLQDWELVEKLSIPTAVDNLVWNGPTQLLAGAHPKLFDLVAHFDDPQALSPSHVIAINVKERPMTFETLYMNDGAELSGSSVAVRLGSEMLIGSVAENHFLRCHPG